MHVDDLLRGLLFQRFRLGTVSFDFLEGLLAVCITGTAYLLRTPFLGIRLPNGLYMLAEWYLALAAAALVWHLTKSRKKALLTYGMILILPVTVAEGTILRGNACVGALLFVCALLFLVQSEGRRRGAWLFTLVTAGLLLWSVRYTGLLMGCVALWQNRRLKAEQLFLLLAAGGARFFAAYRSWLSAGYTLVAFHWPNVYEIVGREAVQGQPVDPLALVGLFLACGLSVLFLYLISMGGMEPDGKKLLRLFLFGGLFAGYFLPYMDQSYGYLPCVLAILYVMLVPGEFLAPVLLQIAAFAGYQECFNGESMMPMAVFAVLQFLVILWLGAGLLRDAGIGISLWKRRN